MAHIEPHRNKKGELYFKIKVSCGYVDGKQITHTTSYYPTGTTERQIKKEVNEQAVLFERECKKGKIPLRRMKFSELCEEYFTYEKKKNKLATGTNETYLGYRNRVYKCIGHLYVDKIKRADIQCLIFDLAEGSDAGHPLATKTQKNYNAFLSSVFKYAKKMDYISKNPCEEIEYVEKPSKTREYYNVDEYKTILKAFEEHNAVIHHRVFFMFLIYLGLRRGEALAIEWDQIKDGNLFIEQSTSYNNSNTGVYNKEPKTPQSKRCLKLPKELIEALPLLKEEQRKNKEKSGAAWKNSNRLFCNEIGEPIFPNRPYNYLKDFFKKHNLVFKGLHSCRHTAISYLLHNNVPVSTVSNIAGHSNANVTYAVYDHEIKEATVYGCDVMSNLLNDDEKEK